MSNSIAKTEFSKEEDTTRKMFHYEVSETAVACIHETRLLTTGSRTIRVKSFDSIDEVMGFLTACDSTVVAY